MKQEMIDDVADTHASNGKLSIIVVGSGGREHALAHHAVEHGHDVIVIPGNDGMKPPIQRRTEKMSQAELVEACTVIHPDFVIVGPEQPLVDGLSDRLAEAGLACFGASESAAQLEGSKIFMKDVCVAAGVDTARHHACTNLADGLEALGTFGEDERIVIKADGLCGGKGVSIVPSRAEAQDILRSYFGESRPSKFGTASEQVVIEAFLAGEELSILGVCDGKHASLLPVARDHKTLFDGGRGPNTGGMGAVAPLGPQQGITGAFLERVRTDVFEPIMQELSRRGATYRGLLYAGLMWDQSTDRLAVVEFNIRFGDPEAQAILFGFEGDLMPTLADVARGRDLDGRLMLGTGRPTCTVVVASEGYPDKPVKDRTLLLPENDADNMVFCAGVRRHEDRLRSAGGRVVAATARASSMKEAIENAYSLASQIKLEGMQIRTDIGLSVL